MSSISNTNKNMIKVWYLSENKNSIEVKKIPVFNTYKPIYEMLKCEMVERHYCIDKDGIGYAILMDEEGLYNNAPINICAEKFIKKIPLNWGNEILTGRFLIYAFKETDHNEKIDMPNITPRELIDKWNIYAEECRIGWENYERECNEKGEKITKIYV